MFEEGFNEDKFDIKVSKDRLIIRTIDNIGYPIDSWVFEKDKLTKTESVFVSNIISMAKSMTSDRDELKKRNNE